MFGYTRKEIIGKFFAVLFLGTDVKRGLPEFDMATAPHGGAAAR